MKPYYFALLGLLLLCTAALRVQAQSTDSSKTATLQQMIESHNYAFKAQTAMPMAGRMIQLTSDYDLQVYPDKIIASLPYYGRAYSAPIDPSQGGIMFTSKDFNYTAAKKKKDRWEIAIRTKDQSTEQLMQLSIFSNGSASLQVNSTNRQSISFNGYVTGIKKK